MLNRYIFSLLLCLLLPSCASETQVPQSTGALFADLLEAGLGYHYSGRAVDYVVVNKAEQQMFLFAKEKMIKDYIVSLGGNPFGHKQQEGDQRTPEGWYFLDYKKADSAYYKAIHISYPNINDRVRAAKLGVSPGGQIMIHGQRNGSTIPASVVQQFNWTAGCIAITNQEMDELWSLIEVGTPIMIRP